MQKYRLVKGEMQLSITKQNEKLNAPYLSSIGMEVIQKHQGGLYRYSGINDKMSNISSLNPTFESMSKSIDEMNRIVNNSMSKSIDEMNRIVNNSMSKSIDEVNRVVNSSMFKSITKVNKVVNSSMSESIAKVNKVVNESIKRNIDLINNISNSINFDELNKLMSRLKKQLQDFIIYCQNLNLSMKLEYFSLYYEIYVKYGRITDEDVYVTFKKHYSKIKNNLLKNDFYKPKQFYINRVIDNFENKRYVEASMLLLASIDYLTIYQTYSEKRETKYKRINRILNQDIKDNEDELNQVINENAINTIKTIYSSHNDIEDPDYINRNRLMHGVMEAENIKKIDCIKLIYILDLLSVMKIVIQDTQNIS
ncbi:TPA: hypothetical protein K8938_000866 [Staphylococcus pseudintermedius]|nr:hypothetical protein [Staphylococcus pseudintermedius]EJD5652543.1 hypothetical protein [Staphylococcus pseudintermedius]EJM2415066.1 hypothetical protein [Staphylococcus pseudintermedius]MDK4060512.1 hypothetical protein [Staphylococcus pseudintermedius]HCA7428174.1 hypothetical protein [Staphylococcus pseudintermedius]